MSVVAQLERSEKMLSSVEPGAVLADCEHGVRFEGNVLQLGLRPAEIDGIEVRIKDLLAKVETGKVELY